MLLLLGETGVVADVAEVIAVVNTKLTKEEAVLVIALYQGLLSFIAEVGATRVLHQGETLLFFF